MSKSWFYRLFWAPGQMSLLCSLTAQLNVIYYCLQVLHGFEWNKIKWDNESWRYVAKWENDKAAKCELSWVVVPTDAGHANAIAARLTDWLLSFVLWTKQWQQIACNVVIPFREQQKLDYHHCNVHFNVELAKWHTLHTHTHLTALFPGLLRWASTRKVNQSGFYWSKRQWVAVASAGPYASLHLDPDR